MNVDQIQLLIKLQTRLEIALFSKTILMLLH